ncbi:MAG: right-handed parallel beta-helix repeat-containing protein [Myxococcota bacterium]
MDDRSHPRWHRLDHHRGAEIHHTEAGINFFNARNLVIRNNHIHDITTGIHGSAIDVLLDRNVVTHTNDNDRCWLCTPDNPYNKWSHAVYCSGSDFTITNNILTHNGGYSINMAGYPYDPEQDLTPAYGGADGWLISNNFFAFNNTMGIAVWQRDATNSLIQNNIFYENHRLEDVHQNAINFNNSGPGHVVRNNISYSSAGKPPFAHSDATTYTVVNTQEVDPLLVDPDNGDYRLRDGSPAAGAGNADQAPSHDILGNPRPTSGPVSIGPYEFGDVVDVPMPPSLARSENLRASSNNFASDHGVEHLWDSCTAGTPACTTGAGSIAGFWLEFDFGSLHRLSRARLFGDADGNWISSAWSLFYKVDGEDGWTEAVGASDAQVNDWVSHDLNVLARFVRVEVNGSLAGTGTQARELQIYGEPQTCVPTQEICDGEDNDCGGLVGDESRHLGDECTTGVGACLQRGVVVCDADAKGTTCSAVALTPASEICDDGLDNDCDGDIDAADANCRTGVVCPENYEIVVNPDDFHPDTQTVVVSDTDGNPVTCARTELDAGATGCAGTGGLPISGVVLLFSGLMTIRRRFRSRR